MNIVSLIIYYLVAINIVAFFVYGIDKLKAKRNRWRIPESTLLLLAVIGGSVGALLGMKVWHHKTMHKKFTYGIPLIIAVQILFLNYLFFTSEVFVVHTRRINMVELRSFLFIFLSVSSFFIFFAF